MPNPNPEGRVGVAFLLIGVVSAYVFLLSVWAGNAANPIALVAILAALLIGWGLRKRFQPPKPPPGPNIVMRWKSRIGGVGKKPAAPAKPGASAPAKPGASGPPKPAAPPPPKKGGMGFLKPKTKAPPKK